MPSILDQVNEAEARAAQLKKDAARMAKEKLAAAQADADALLAAQADADHKALDEGVWGAEAEGEQIALQVQTERTVENREACARAREKLPEAVDYLMERLMGKA